MAPTDPAWMTLTERLRPVRAERRYGPEVLTIGGLETRVPADHYHWDGLRRGAHPAHPFVLFQVTLGGWGIYEDRRCRAQRLTPGRAFVSVAPSAHRYYLPEESPGWTFFWLILRHPYLAHRIAERQQETGVTATVLDLSPESDLLKQAVGLFSASPPDPLAEEAAVFQWLISYERQVRVRPDRSDPDTGERAALLSFLRQQVLSDLAVPVSVEAAARESRMSRTRFSHHVKAVTGIAPAAYMAQVRLEEVARRLAQTDTTLAAIAEETGFADSNHLCKAFRRHYHLSPGTFRRQMR